MRRLCRSVCGSDRPANSRTPCRTSAGALQRIRQPRTLNRDAQNCVRLSRVTLGADVAITSVLLDAAKKRFPQRANLVRRATRKAGSSSPQIRGCRHVPIAYGRGGTLDDRLSIWPQLRDAVCQPDSIVIDPDSRLTQLGLLPICPEDDYYFFESRAYGGDGDEPLSALARRWAAETFGVADANPISIPDSMPPNMRVP